MWEQGLYISLLNLIEIVCCKIIKFYRCQSFVNYNGSTFYFSCKVQKKEVGGLSYFKTNMSVIYLILVDCNQKSTNLFVYYNTCLIVARVPTMISNNLKGLSINPLQSVLKSPLTLRFQRTWRKEENRGNLTEMRVFWISISSPLSRKFLVSQLLLYY